MVPLDAEGEEMFPKTCRKRQEHDARLALEKALVIAGLALLSRDQLHDDVTERVVRRRGREETETPVISVVATLVEGGVRAFESVEAAEERQSSLVGALLEALDSPLGLDGQGPVGVVAGAVDLQAHFGDFHADHREDGRVDEMRADHEDLGLREDLLQILCVLLDLVDDRSCTSAGADVCRSDAHVELRPGIDRQFHSFSVLIVKPHSRVNSDLMVALGSASPKCSIDAILH